MTDVDLNDWVVVSRQWWRTPSTTVSWAYNQPKSSKRLYARAPHRPELLTRKDSTTSRQLGAGFHGQDEAHEMELNEGLVGVRGVFDVLSVYEGHVGIKVVKEKPQPDLSRKVDEKEVALHQTRWRELMENFVGDLPEQTSDSSDSEGSGSPLFSSFESSRSSVSSFEVSEWERDHSMSMPSTPKAKAPRSRLEDWVSPRETRSCNLSPFGASPSKRLNASAIAFVPQLPRPESQPAPSRNFSDSSPQTSASSSSPPLLDFTFPSLNVPSIPKLKIEKDDQGFYTGIEEDGSGAHSKTRTTALLPAFLQEESPRRKLPSRTRAMVDRLRSTPSQPILGPLDHHLDRASGSESEADTDLRSSTPSIVDDGEGWIDVDTSTNTSENSIAARAQRKRDLFLALNKHQRSESSLTSSTSPEQAEPPELSSSTVTEYVNDDGWIESIPQAQTKKFRRRPPRRPGAAKLAEISSTLGGTTPVFPTLNPTGPGSQEHKSRSSVPSVATPRAPVSQVPAPVPVSYVYGGYPVMAPMHYPPPYPPVMQYPGVQPALHQRTPSLVPPVGYAPSGKAPFVPPQPMYYPPSSGIRPMW
ncbi:hypothetical protein D9758_005970 [Tetrapyrgos nigripes]|uniref:Uncharacterized protein n=1 Tax=Tetrapyrgos nigripes TaxID=182062 RepID=A0A8H5LH70_9AGAR|nr:hypothetical protein D9758_005970 [Tetrapyrgos nigripes]